MSEQSVIFYIGYHKTGTTWMQARLFVPAFGYAPLMTHRQVWDMIVAPHALAFDPAPAAAFIAGARAAAPEGLTPVVSSEILCGMPLSGSRESAEFARRIKVIAPDARILITIRAQIPMIVATYMQYVRRGGTRSPRRFFTHDPSPGYDQFDAGTFRYDRLVECYQGLFGPDRVRVMTQEMLVAAPARFVGELAAWAGRRTAPDLPDTRRGSASPIPKQPRPCCASPTTSASAMRPTGRWSIPDGSAPLPSALFRHSTGTSRCAAWQADQGR